MDNLIIRAATKSDVPAILGLIQELATFEREPDAVAVTEAELLQDGFGENPAFGCFVATNESKVVGIALYYPCYSTWKGKSWHLEDLIVTEPHRGKGIGFALLKKFISFAYNTGVRRIQWVVLNWNTRAINFYEKQGAKTMSDWNITQMTEGAMQKFTAEQDEGI
ncbi:MAG: GNAT family N-acetyltransferase [Flavobacteriaceae bacterium]|nr:GNAT family N-acetyltransferase [Flavobacteriaceae bacterium]|tara:strand:+ start:148 stop:642 length:495 start_codon:yes stop_codon:yes gene_type:complete